MMKPFASLLIILLTIGATDAQISREECADQGGTVVFDIGDGAIFRAGYLCETTNEPPTDIVTGDTVARDGEVCCGGTGDGIDMVDGTSPERPTMTRDECRAEMGGVIVSDPGDGTTHSMDYVCVDSGLPPIGTIVDQPISDEGEVCCGGGDTVERPEMTRAECSEMDGAVVGDIGDGAIHSPDYVCESNGLSPMGTIVDNTDYIAREGEVCCGAGNSTKLPEMTRDECTEMDGAIVGDIGDGAIHEPGYVCESNGLPPLGTIVDSSGAIAIEGEVCCGDGNSTMLPEMTRAECTEMGGAIVGDIGDGAIHEPGYVCESNGLPPLGTIVDSSGPIAIEGEVCCGDGNSTMLPEMTRDECAEMDGAIVGDIGDGAIHESGYVCESNGLPPLGTIVVNSGPIAIEGEVCCGYGNSTMLPEMTRDECTEMDGAIVGDIGDGGIHEPGYVCESNGLPPLGTIGDSSGAIAVEGEVCCGSGNTTISGTPCTMYHISGMAIVTLGALFLTI
jgi:hypothetical protein